MRNQVLAAAAACCIACAFGCSKVGVQSGPARSYSVPGTLRYADVQEVSGLNPLTRLEAVGTDLDMFIYGFFFNLDDKMRYVPELATQVPTTRNGGISKDGLTITYHLRRGVKWHDGAPFTARDVLFTVGAINNPKNNLQTRVGFDDIKSVEAVGDYEVRFHLKKIYAPAVATFFGESGLYPVLPAHLLARYPDINHVPFNAHPIGTGPFKFVKWVHGDHIELEANRQYWRGAPKLAHVIYRTVPDENTILIQLKTHEIDAWFRAPSNLYPQLRELRDYNVQLAPSLVFSHLDLNQKNPIFTDLRVRQAINYALDKDKIIRDLTHGANVRAYSDVPPFSWAYEPNVMHYGYDPQKARQLLDAAGWRVGPGGLRQKAGRKLAFNLSAVTGGKTGEAVEYFAQSELKQIGIQAAVKNYPASLFFAAGQEGGILQSGRYDAAFYSWVSGSDPDDSSLYRCNAFSPAGQNDLFWCDPKLDAAEVGALSSYDPAVRKKYYAVVQQELAAQSVTIFIYFQRQIFVTSPDLHGFVPAPATSSNWNTWEWSI